MGIGSSCIENAQSTIVWLLVVVALKMPKVRICMGMDGRCIENAQSATMCVLMVGALKMPKVRL